MDVPTPPRDSLPWPYTWDRVLGRSVAGVAWLLGLSIVAGLGAFLWYRTTVEPEPGFPVQYAPPPGLGPVQLEYIRTESMPKNGLTATLFYLGERKLVELKQVSDKQWNVTGIANKGDWADVDPVSVAVGSALKVMGRGAEFEAKSTVKAGERLSKAKTDMAEAVEKWAFDDGLMVKRRKELWTRAANAMAAILALCGFFRWGFPITLWGLPFAAFFAFSMARVGRRRRHPAHRGGAPIVVAGRRFPPPAGHRLGGDPVRLRRAQGPLHRIHPVRRGGGCRGPVGQEVSGDDGGGCTATGLVLLVVHDEFGVLLAVIPVAPISTASNQRCRRRSAHTPHRSHRRRAAVAAAAAASAVAVAAAAAEEEVGHGEVRCSSWYWSSRCWC